MATPEERQAINDAKAYFEELLMDDKWYAENKGKIIAVSARPRAYVTAESLEKLRRDPAYKELGIWYRCQVDRQKEGRAIPDHASGRARLLAPE